MTTPSPSRAPRRIVLLTGPSGSGKGVVSRRAGVPALNLDDFYREGDDPTLPRRFGIPDWDHPASWDAGAALRALTALAHDGAAEIPTYSIALSRRTGSARLELGDAPVLIAEGIFAAELIAPLAAAGLLAEAIVLDRAVPVVFTLRLARDLREHRKPVPILLQRGTALALQQRDDMHGWVRAGLRPDGLRAAVRRIREIVVHAEAERHCRPASAARSRLRIAAVCFLRDAPAGTAPGTELLCVRKHGTGSWMQVGGKLDGEESAREAALREVEEELGVRLHAEELDPLGEFEAVAANEPGTVVHASVFLTRTPLPGPLQVRAELAEHRWIPLENDGAHGNGGRLAPLMREHILPALRRREASRRP
ncbi:NUDIX domain-containing protein [Brachybacterium saurashtrense]|uniref:NUDIX domain-containing protein n=1 Tax=Brachybacterium saurashtrense TaxID=556288 RepID=A0A345YNR7_9MICO|nr:NUDIX domain-containing protein [Brachybacterium saurashtrense]AXK45569.1 NUDIX domain-containing protein [Brachybacterium saurashtrense]RRR21060.1 NUDIX domain-containing protein [Brachybacterium saurashtrense]